MRAILLLVVACALMIYSPSALAQKLLSPAEFRDAEIARIRAAAPDAQIVIRDDLGITLSVPSRPDISNMQVNLDNAYRNYQNEPDQLDAILARWTRIAIDHSDQVRTRERLVSVVRSHVRAQAIEQMLSTATTPAHLVSRTFAGDLDEVLAFDSADAVAYATDANLHELGLLPDDAWNVARQNLPTRMGEVETAPAPSVEGILIVGGGNGLAPSSLLDPAFCGGSHARDMIFVPDRESYFIAARSTPGAFQFLRGFAAHLYQSGESESATVLVCQSGHLVAESD